MQINAKKLFWTLCFAIVISGCAATNQYSRPSPQSSSQGSDCDVVFYSAFGSAPPEKGVGYAAGYAAQKKQDCLRGK